MRQLSEHVLRWDRRVFDVSIGVNGVLDPPRQLLTYCDAWIVRDHVFMWW